MAPETPSSSNVGGSNSPTRAAVAAVTTTVGGRKILLTYICFTGLFLTTISINILLLAGLFYYPSSVGLFIVLPYYTYTTFVSKYHLQNGNRWKYFSEHFFVFQMMRDYFQLEFKVCSKKLLEQVNIKGKVNKEEDKKTQQPQNQNQFMFAVFPHGTAGDYRVMMDGVLRTVFPPNISERTRVLAASVLFKIPLIRELSLWTGCIDASRSVAEKNINDGYSIMVLPGGEAEQIRTVYQKERVYLRNRKGFIKLAIMKGIPIVPTYVFGASDYYQTSNAFFQPRLWLQKKCGICIPFAFGQWGSTFVPLPVKTTIVFGDPISFTMKEPSSSSPTNEELNSAHEQFCNALRDLFDSQKKHLGYGDRELEMM